MNRSHINGKYSESAPYTNSTGLPLPLLLLIFKRLESSTSGDNPQQGHPR